MDSMLNRKGSRLNRCGRDAPARTASRTWSSWTGDSCGNGSQRRGVASGLRPDMQV